MSNEFPFSVAIQSISQHGPILCLVIYTMENLEVFSFFRSQNINLNRHTFFHHVNFFLFFLPRFLSFFFFLVFFLFFSSSFSFVFFRFTHLLVPNRHLVGFVHLIAQDDIIFSQNAMPSKDSTEIIYCLKSLILPIDMHRTTTNSNSISKTEFIPLNENH